MKLILEIELGRCTIFYDGKYKVIKGNTINCIYTVLDLLLFEDAYGDIRQGVIPCFSTYGVGQAYKEVFDKIHLDYIELQKMDNITLNEDCGYEKYKMATEQGVIPVR